MSSSKDFRILQVVQSKSMDLSECKIQNLVPMQSVKLIHPQQPNDSHYHDLLQTPDDVKLFIEHNTSDRKGEDNDEIQKENYSYSIDTKYFKRTNTDIGFSDSFGNYFKSIKLLFTDKMVSKQIGSLVKQLLSDEKKGKKIQKNQFFKYMINVFEQLIFTTHISISILNPAIKLINLPVGILAIQIIILLTQIICKCKQNKYKFLDILPLLCIIFMLLLTMIETKIEIKLFLILLLSWSTIHQLWQFSFFYRYYKVIQLIYIAIQQCHTFTCLLIMLDENNQQQVILKYIYNFQCFFGNFLGLGGQSSDDQLFIYYIFLVVAWSVFWIIKVLLFQELYLQIQQQKIIHKEQQNTIQFIQVLKKLKLVNTHKLCTQIQDFQINQKEIRKIQDQNQLMNHFPLKDSLKNDIFQSDKMQLLLRFGLFKKLSTQTLNYLVKHLEICYFQNDDIIIQQQLDDQSIYFIKKGTVQVYFGKQITLLGDNQYFGQVSFLTGLGRSASVKSKGECCLFKLRRKDFFSSITDRDIEIVNYIKDEIILNNNYGSIELNCYNCMSSNHCIKYCPQLHLCLNKEKLIIGYLQPYSQKRRSFQRVKSNHTNVLSSLRHYQAKCQEFQDDQGLVSSLGETDHTNYQQNQSFQTYTQQSSLPQKMLGAKVLLRPSTFENVPSIEQDSLKEQQFREVDQLFIRSANPKATTSTAGFGQKENNSQKSPKLDVNNTISEIQSEDSSEQESSIEEDDVSANSRNTHEYRIKGLRQSTYRSDRSQFKSGVSSISMSYTPKQQSQLSLLNTLNQKSDNNVQINTTSQKQISPLQLREKEDKQSTLTSNLLQLPPKKSQMNPISQLNYEISPFVAHSQILVKNDLIWSAIESDKIQSYNFYYPHYNINEVLIRYQCIQKGMNKSEQKFTKYNTL